MEDTGDKAENLYGYVLGRAFNGTRPAFTYPSDTDGCDIFDSDSNDLATSRSS